MYRDFSMLITAVAAVSFCETKGNLLKNIWTEHTIRQKVFVCDFFMRTTPTALQHLRSHFNTRTVRQPHDVAGVKRSLTNEFSFGAQAQKESHLSVHDDYR